MAGHLSAVVQDTLLAGQIESTAGLSALNALNGCGAFCGSTAQARSWAGHGATMLVIGSDYALLAGTAAETARAIRAVDEEDDG